MFLAAAPLATSQTRPDWRKIGSSAVEFSLASPSTGAVAQVWFSPDGGALYAHTAAGRTYVTQDFETWRPALATPPQPVMATAARTPGASIVVADPADPRHLYALGQQLYRSEDGGQSWTDLTRFQSASIVGTGQHSVAVSPLDPDQLVLGNDFGVWRSLDGGLTWAGLNGALPNLRVDRILTTGGSQGTEIEAAGYGVLDLPPGGSNWFPANSSTLAAEASLMAQASRITGAEITAAVASGSTVYAGSRDGRIWVSLDGGNTFRPSRTETAGPVERFYVDPIEPRVALAALSGSGPHVLRTTSTGSLWDDLTGNLSDTPAHGITADRSAGAVYVATDRGVFLTRTDLENATVPTVNWVNLSGSLPAVPATDVRLNPSGVQLYAALDGYGVYATAAPHRLWQLRVVNAADFSARAAAPGSLLSIVGGRVDSARGGSLTYPVLSTSDRESQIQVPFEAVGPNVSLSLQTSAGQVSLPVIVQPISPAIFVSRDGVPLIYDADSGLPLDIHNPAHSGGRIQILATGLGKVRPDWPTNMAAPLQNPPAISAQVQVYLDGAPIQVTSATLAPSYIGFYLIEAQLPAINNLGTSELYLSAGGQDSNKVQIVVEQ